MMQFSELPRKRRLYTTTEPGTPPLKRPMPCAKGSKRRTIRSSSMRSKQRRRRARGLGFSTLRRPKRVSQGPGLQKSPPWPPKQTLQRALALPRPPLQRPRASLPKVLGRTNARREALEESPPRRAKARERLRSRRRRRRLRARLNRRMKSWLWLGLLKLGTEPGMRRPPQNRPRACPPQPSHRTTPASHPARPRRKRRWTAPPRRLWKVPWSALPP
mmetsp:Transcript_17403/g.58797  ORF Transcript_17403/g.58797 Transcript_17403/m.58797 type:complete len:217 (-) Transcript_17403:567-1217(-)